MGEGAGGIMRLLPAKTGGILNKTPLQDEIFKNNQEANSFYNIFHQSSKQQILIVH